MNRKTYSRISEDTIDLQCIRMIRLKLLSQLRSLQVNSNVLFKNCYQLSYRTRWNRNTLSRSSNLPSLWDYKTDSFAKHQLEFRTMFTARARRSYHHVWSVKDHLITSGMEVASSILLSTTPKLSWRALAIGAKLFVVHEAPEITVSVPSRTSWLCWIQLF